MQFKGEKITSNYFYRYILIAIFISSCPFTVDIQFFFHTFFSILKTIERNKLFKIDNYGYLNLMQINLTY